MSRATAAASHRNLLPLPRPCRSYSLPVPRYRLKTPPLSPSLYSQFTTFEPKKSRFVSPVKNPSRWPIAVCLSGNTIPHKPNSPNSPKKKKKGEDVNGSRGNDLPGQPSFDTVLSVVQVLCIVPPTIYSMGCLIGSALPPAAAKQFQVSAGNKFFVGQYFLLVGAVAIGCLIRWRQRRWLYRVNERGVSVDLIRRVEKVEEDLRSSTTIIRVLSRQLEKLGIRFRVTRKTLKEPIAETAVLAQKNSEATRALAMQEDILEKELGEIQKVLLAMQEQQQKQLELILAIAKAGKLFDGKRESALEEGSTTATTRIPEKREKEELKVQSKVVAGGNDKA